MGKRLKHQQKQQGQTWYRVWVKVLEAEGNMSHGVESPGQTSRWGVGHDSQEVVEQHPEYQGPAK